MNRVSEQEARKFISEIKQRRIAEEKRKFYEAKRIREASNTPMAEGPDLKSAQCQFESDLEDGGKNE